MADGLIDLGRYRWRAVVGEPDAAFPVRHDYAILGYDLAAGTLDMLVRWAGDGGHCPIHRHVSTTTVLVLEGEQHLWDLARPGARGPHRVRRAGDYALTVGDAHPHLERGGAEGGVVFFANHAADGRLYELFDESLALVAEVTMQDLVADWEANASLMDTAARVEGR